MNRTAAALVEDLQADLVYMYPELETDTDVAGTDFNTFWTLRNVRRMRALQVSVQQTNNGPCIVTALVLDGDDEQVESAGSFTLTDASSRTVHAFVTLALTSFRHDGAF